MTEVSTFLNRQHFFFFTSRRLQVPSASPAEHMALKRPISPIKKQSLVLSQGFNLPLSQSNSYFSVQQLFHSSLSLSFNLGFEGRGTFSQPRSKKKKGRKEKNAWLRAALVSPVFLQMLRVFSPDFTLRRL